MAEPFIWVSSSFDGWRFEKQKENNSWIELYQFKFYDSYSEISFDIEDDYPIIMLYSQKQDVYEQLSPTSSGYYVNKTSPFTFQSYGYWLRNTGKLSCSLHKENNAIIEGSFYLGEKCFMKIRFI